MSYRRATAPPGRLATGLALAASGAYLAAGYYCYSSAAADVAEAEAAAEFAANEREAARRRAEEAKERANEREAARKRADEAKKRANEREAARKRAEELEANERAAAEEVEERADAVVKAASASECISRYAIQARDVVLILLQKFGLPAKSLINGMRLSQAAVMERLRRLTPHLPTGVGARLMQKLLSQPLEFVQSHPIYRATRAAVGRSSAIFNDLRRTYLGVLQDKLLEWILSAMDLLQLLNILASRDPLFSSISAPRLLSIYLPHRGGRDSLAEALCIMAKLAAMAISLLSFAATGPHWGEWEGVSGGIGFLVLPFCFFVLAYDRFAVAPSNAFGSVIKTTLLLLIGGELLRAADPRPGGALYDPHIRQLLRQGNSTQTLTNDYRFQGSDPLIGCLLRAEASPSCAGIANEALDTRNANHELRSIILHSIEAAPAELLDRVLWRARIDNDTQSVQIDSAGFKYLSAAINNKFAIGSLIGANWVFPVDTVWNVGDNRQDVLSPRAPCGRAQAYRLRQNAAAPSYPSGLPRELCMQKFAAAVLAAPLISSSPQFPQKRN